jgi:ABC-type transporter Mla MlaB component
MAKKKEKGLIGFDPLAWMNDESVQVENSENRVDVVEMSEEVDVVIDKTENVTTETAEVNDKLIDTTVELSNDESDSSKTLLDATLNIQNVGVLYEKLFKQLEHQNKIEIDASAVASIDTATLQMLIVLKQTAIKGQKEVTIDFPSDRFIEAAQLLGLSEMLEVDQAAAGFF